jgi:peptide/nickel transport system substrate-binding protein
VREHLNNVTDYSGIIGLITCDAFGDCGSQKITVIGHADSTDVSASNANVVYEYAPAGSSEGSGDLVAPVIPVRGGTIVFASTQTGAHVNHGVQSGIGVANPSSKIYASLMALDENWQPTPYLAESWEVSDDQKTITIHITDKATFHDGVPITSADVEFSIQVVKQNHPFTGMWGPLESIDTPDDHTVVLHLANPHPALWIAMSDVMLPIMPKHVLGDGTVEMNDMKNHPGIVSGVVGSGPFTLNPDTVLSEKIILDAYDGFWMPGRPYLDRIVYMVVKDENAMVLGLESGDYDHVAFASVSNAKRLSDNDDIVYIGNYVPGVGSLNHLQFNMAHPVISDLRVRQAIAYAIDRDFVTEQLHQGSTMELLGGIHPSSPFYNADVERYDVDLDKARALLAEAGYADGLDLTINYIPGPAEQQRTVAEYIARAVEDIGINMTVIDADTLGAWAGIFFGGPEAWHMTMNAYFNWGDPVIGVQRAYVCDNIKPGVFVNNSSYCNEKVDELLYAAAASGDPDERKALYDEFQEITAVELPFYGINALPIFAGHQSDIMGLPVGPWGNLSGLQDVWIDR